MTGKLDGFPAMVVEALNGWQLFRQMGYPAEEIFLAFIPKDDDHDVLIMLKHRGKEVALRIGTLNGAAPEEFQEHWAEGRRGLPRHDDRGAQSLLEELDGSGHRAFRRHQHAVPRAGGHP
jgi:hypothetical protein